jgi:hypothetical protein
MIFLKKTLNFEDLGPVWNLRSKNFEILFLLKINIFLVFLNCFDVLISKIILKI